MKLVNQGFTAEQCTLLREGVSTPIFGQWHQDRHYLHFKPVIPFTHGLTYRFMVAGNIVETFTVSTKAMAPTKVVCIYPSIDTVPENLLKIYVRFSAPMGDQYSESFIHMTDQSGDTLDKIFLPLQPELWNAKHDILTLWLDPGRIKRELGPNKTWGTPLEAGDKYIIHISPEWKDKHGVPLGNSHQKTLIAGLADRAKLTIDEWDLELPLSGTNQPLVVNFNASLDYLLLQECLTITRDKEVVPGTSQVNRTQSNWCFTGEEPWSEGIYELQVESRLEDIAGNNLNRLFDEEIDVSKPSPDISIYRRSFAIK